MLIHLCLCLLRDVYRIISYRDGGVRSFQDPGVVWREAKRSEAIVDDVRCDFLL